MLIGLAFLPLDKVTEGFRAVCRSIEQSNLPAAVNELVEYMARTYVGSISLSGSEK